MDNSIISGLSYFHAPQASMETGKLIVFTAPSGAGKTTIVKKILSLDDRFAFSVSACTRPKRPEEQHGRDYYFLSPDEFRKLIAEDAFIEWEQVYDGLYYGTLKTEIERLWSMGKHVLLDIDVVGAKNIKDAYGDRAMVVFVKPPDLQTLIGRLKNRNTETDGDLQKRIKKMEEELSWQRFFDRILINDNLDQAVNSARDLIESYLNENKQ